MSHHASLLITLVLFAIVHAKFVEETQGSTSDEFVYVTKFCFDTSGPGTLNFTADAGDGASKLLLALYDDQSGSWPATYGNSKLTCAEKLANAKLKTPFINNVPLGIQFNDYERPHYWYFAIVNCDTTTYQITYHIQMTQYKDDWNRQFSYDEEGLQLMYILFFVAYVIGFGAHIFGDIQYLRARSLHPIIQLLSVSITCQFLSVLFYMIHYANYAGNGVGVPACKTLGEITDILSVLAFMLLLILIAKGWGITYPTLSHIQEQKKVLIIIVSILFACYITLFFWGQFGLDPATTLYIYQSVPGIILLVVRFFTLIYFIWCLQKTLRESDSSKRFFYVLFGGCFALWFISLPLIVLLSLGLSGWYREKAVDALEISITTVAYFGLGFLLWPTRASKYFQITGPDVFSGGYDRL